MLGINIIEDLLEKMGLEDYGFSPYEDNNIDFIRVTAPELDFNMIKTCLLKVKRLRESLVDNGPAVLLCEIRSCYDGYNFVYYFKIVKNESFGVDIYIMTKKVDYYAGDGSYVPFISFQMMREYLVDSNE